MGYAMDIMHNKCHKQINVKSCFQSFSKNFLISKLLPTWYMRNWLCILHQLSIQFCQVINLGRKLFCKLLVHIGQNFKTKYLWLINESCIAI